MVVVGSQFSKWTGNVSGDGVLEGEGERVCGDVMKLVLTTCLYRHVCTHTYNYLSLIFTSLKMLFFSGALYFMFNLLPFS